MNTITYPKAEKLANTMELPVMVDPDTMELYGYKWFILDKPAARLVLYNNGIYPETDQFNAAIEILRDRINKLN